MGDFHLDVGELVWAPARGLPQRWFIPWKLSERQHLAFKSPKD